MGISSNICVVVLLVLTIVVPSIGVQGPTKRDYPVIFNFGDSNSDTGALPALRKANISLPYGETFFGHSAGRFSDGRLIIDFIAERLKMPLLMSGYLYLNGTGTDSDTDFRNGANFAVAGACVTTPWDTTLLALENQVLNFLEFKARVKTTYEKYGSDELERQNLPMPKDFDEALYMFDIAQNDLSGMLQNAPVNAVKMLIPLLVCKINKVIVQLYFQGARHFWVHNTGPVGCLPDTLININPNSKLEKDEYGCLKNVNAAAAQEFNKQLKDELSQLSTMLTESTITYVDVYTAKYELIAAAKERGFEDPLVSCWPLVNGNRGDACDNPSRHISFDGTHYSEAANEIFAQRIMDGSLSFPPMSIEEACRV